VTDSASASFYASLVRARVAAGALITDAGGRILIVEPTYKDHWEIPGGIVEQGETPSDACLRELREELGLNPPLGRLLVVEYKTEAGPRGDSATFVYDAGVLIDPGQVKLALDELKAFAFVPVDELQSKLTAGLTRRLTYAVAARRDGATIELNNGVPR
jgi:8-oxo-dGTP diphosphatase